MIKELIEGLEQTFITKDGKQMTIKKAISPKEVWTTNGHNRRTIISHSGVQKIADMAGIDKVVQYQVLTQPDAYNNYQYTMMATVSSKRHGTATEIGEANRSNLGTKGRGNPANMAQKRAYDRAVFRLLGITGILSEEELSDEETQETMEGLTHDERKSIAPLINQLMLAKDNKQLIQFSNQMKIKSKELNDNQLNYMRKLYKKRVAELQKDKF